MARLSKEQARLARQVGLLTAIPFVLLAGPALGYLLGSWLDRRFGTAPVFLIIMIILGFVAAGRETYQLIRRASREDPENGSSAGSQRR